jgi:hypothetical protein
MPVRAAWYLLALGGIRIIVLRQFDVRGEQISGDDTETIIREGGRRRGLVRYRLEGRELYVHARINVARLRLPVQFLSCFSSPNPAKTN